MFALICLKIMKTFFFDSMIMLRFAETKIANEKFYGAKEPINLLDVNLDYIVISLLVETKTNSKYLIEFLDKVS